MGLLNASWLTWSLLPFLLIGMWLYTTHVTSSFPILRGQRILLLIAHPDDEAMFFAPSLLALTKPEHGNHIKILCLSSGDADGLGEVRKKELVKSALLLGIRSADDVFVIESPDFPDSMTKDWDSELISNLLTDTFAPGLAKMPRNKAPATTIDAIITFDKAGISSHPNHRSLYHGSIAFLKSLMQRHTGWDCPISLYTLTTTNMLRKYISLFDAPMTMWVGAFRNPKAGSKPSQMIFLSTPGAYRTAQKAMTTAHESQMRWFRWGWISISRYMMLNDLKKEKI